jgi:chromosome partitioning protein
MPGAADRQQSAPQWRAPRPPVLPAIRGWDLAHDGVVRPPRGTTHVVLDTPAGLHGKKFDDVMKIADRVIVPLQPSLFDIQASHVFLQQLAAHKRSDRVSVGVVGVRVRG